MKRKMPLSIVIIIVALAISVMFAACEPQIYGRSEQPSASAEPISIDVNFDELLSFTALLEDSYIYLGVDGSTATYYRTFFNGETVVIGQVHNFYLSMKQSVLIYPKLYLYVSTYDEVISDSTNDLVCLDLSTNECKIFRHYDGSIAGVSTYEFCGDIVTLKNSVSADSITTYIDKYDISDGVWKSFLVNSMDIDTYVGSAIFALCSDGSLLYVLYDERTQSGSVDTCLKIYDGEFTEIESIMVSKEIHDYVLTSQISDMQIFGDYLYIYNASNYGFLGQIVDGNLVEVLSERNLELSSSHFDSSELQI